MVPHQAPLSGPDQRAGDRSAQRRMGLWDATHNASRPRAHPCPHRRTSGTPGSTADGVPPAPACHTGADSSMAKRALLPRELLTAGSIT
jgi:hypothetical protein